MKAMMRAARSSTLLNSPLRSRRPFQDREEKLDLIEPRGMGRGVVQEDPRVVVEERLDFRGEVGREVVDDAVQLHAGWRLVVEVGEEVDEVLGPRRVGDPGADV